MLTRPWLSFPTGRSLLVHPAQGEDHLGPGCAAASVTSTDDTGWGSWVSSETHLCASYPSPRPLPTSKIFIPIRTFTFLFLEPVSFPICFFSEKHLFITTSFQAPKSKITTRDQSSNFLTYFLMSNKFRTILKFERPRSFQEETWTTRHWRMSELKSFLLSEIRLNDKNDLKTCLSMNIPDVISAGVFLLWYKVSE